MQVLRRIAVLGLVLWMPLNLVWADATVDNIELYKQDGCLNAKPDDRIGWAGFTLTFEDTSVTLFKFEVVDREGQKLEYPDIFIPLRGPAHRDGVLDLSHHAGGEISGSIYLYPAFGCRNGQPIHPTDLKVVLTPIR